MARIILLIIFIGSLCESFGQYQWKLEKEKEGITIYSSDIAGRSYKAVKVEGTFRGTPAKLVSLLSNVPNNKQWVYNTRASFFLRQINPLDFIYYTETNFPWPLSNRDAVIHLRIRTDSMPKFFTISGTGEPGLVPEIMGTVRVPHYSANWIVTAPTQQTIHISYILEADPGGSIPSWLSNIFIDKGPYETFKKLGEMMGK